MPMIPGKVHAWDRERAFGYVHTDDHRRVFVGRHIVRACGLGDELMAGTRVQISARQAPTGGWQAAKVELAPAEAV